MISVYLSMAIKKIIQDAFEQVIETGKDIGKSSIKQIGETLSPWDMIRNSFSENAKTPENSSAKSKFKEMQGNGGKGTPLDFDKLQKSYADQDKMKIESMKQRLFQLVKNEDTKTAQRKDQKAAEKKQLETQEIIEQQRKEAEMRQRNSMSNAPEGKSGRGTALSGKKRKKPTDPQPIETKPGGSKQ